ncbi:RNA-guided endonuclease InsQ/TnpB family protein [Streptomyces vinaceus]|uniref:RNA-guided endonuclease InsQ/TnpB family protein n=1 Tax=Streptomyces vinaceus TaxID=1960 RepID=UPI0036B65140
MAAARRALLLSACAVVLGSAAITLAIDRGAAWGWFTPGRWGELVRHGRLPQGRRRLPVGRHPARPGHPRSFPGRRHVEVNQHRPVVGKVKTVSVKREGKRWYVVLTAEQTEPEPLPKTGSVAGLDLGIASFFTTSNGDHILNPRHARKAAAKLEAAQQALARCKRRSSRRKKAVAKVADLHRKVRRQRLDHAHKTALRLVREHDFIACEDLKIRNMVKAPAPKPDPDTPGGFLPNGADAKAGLNRSISDAGWGGGVPYDPHQQG